MDTHPPKPVYKIVIAGRLSEQWAAWFDGMAVHPTAETTVLEGSVADQAALHGLLNKIRDLGLPLISLRRMGSPTPHG